MELSKSTLIRLLKSSALPGIGVLVFLLVVAWVVTHSAANPFLYSAG